MEAVCAVRQRHTCPVTCSAFRAYVPTWRKCIHGCACVHAAVSLTPHRQGHIWAYSAAHGTFTCLVPMSANAPIMPSVHMPTNQVHPGLIVLGGIFQHGTWSPVSTEAGERKSVEAHGTLWPSRVHLLSQCLETRDSGRILQAFRCAPKQCRTTKVYERAITQDIGFIRHLGAHAHTHIHTQS